MRDLDKTRGQRASAQLAKKERMMKRYWMGNLLIEANCYADALRLADLVSDGEEIDDAEQDSGARAVVVI